jgi:hypothetical protein
MEPQAEINKVLADDMSEWTAFLHFGGVVGFPNPVDLFKYTNPQYWAKKGTSNHASFCIQA